MERTYVGSTTYASYRKPDGNMVRVFSFPLFLYIRFISLTHLHCLHVNSAEVLMK